MLIFKKNKKIVDNYNFVTASLTLKFAGGFIFIGELLFISI